MKNVELFPSILSADFANLKKNIEIVLKNRIKYLHIDVMDGHFVPNITIGPVVLKSLNKYFKGKVFFDAHLMITSPLKYIEPFIKAGADGISFHIESDDSPAKVIKLLKKHKVKTGIAINPDNKWEKYKKYFKEIDYILMMTVFPGFAGQKFIEKRLEDIKRLDVYLKKHKLKPIIQVDGGINDKTIKSVVTAGARWIVAGSAIFDGNKITGRIKKLRDAIR